MGGVAIMKMVRLIVLGVVCSWLYLWIFVGPVMADVGQRDYSEYMSSSPAANARLTGVPFSVSVRFSAAINVPRSTISITDASGKKVEIGAAYADPLDAQMLSVQIQGSQSEIYIVNWYTTSLLSGQHDAGCFRFFVNASSALQQSLNQAVSASSTDAPGIPQIPLWMAGFLAFIGLAVGIGIYWVFAQQNIHRQEVDFMAQFPPIED